MLTALLALHSNRPDIGFASAGARLAASGQSADAGVRRCFRRIRFRSRALGAAGLCLARAFGQTGLYVAQNTGQIYAGALVAVAVLGFGAGARRCFGRAKSASSPSRLVLTLLYALGKYTPAVPCDLRIAAGRGAVPPAGRRDLRVLRAAGDRRAAIWCTGLLTGTLPPLRPWQRAAEIAIAVALVGDRRRSRAPGRHAAKRRAADPVGRRICRGWRSRRWCWRAALRRAARSRLPRCWRSSASPISAGTTRRTSSTGLKPSQYEALRPDTDERNRRAAQVEAQGRRRARPPRPRRIDRRRLSLAEHRADPRLRSSVRAQSAAARWISSAPPPRPTRSPAPTSGSSRR